MIFPIFVARHLDPVGMAAVAAAAFGAAAAAVAAAVGAGLGTLPVVLAVAVESTGVGWRVGILLYFLPPLPLPALV